MSEDNKVRPIDPVEALLDKAASGVGVGPEAILRARQAWLRTKLELRAARTKRGKSPEPATPKWYATQPKHIRFPVKLSPQQHDWWQKIAAQMGYPTVAGMIRDAVLYYSTSGFNRRTFKEARMGVEGLDGLASGR